MLKIAIVDDDNACLEQEAAYTARYAKEKQLQIETSIFHSGMELMKQLSNRFDIIFLDIEMDGMDGMETARDPKGWIGRSDCVHYQYGPVCD